MDCLLCVEKSINENFGIRINSSTWNLLDVQTVIEKHLWPMINLKAESQCVCLNCWQILEEFHKFYRRIENAQLKLNEIIKPDSDPPNAKDFLSEILLEPEIVLDQAVPFVKQEFKESEDGDTDFNDDDDIPLIQMRQIVGNSLDVLINDSHESIEDPLIKKGRTSKAKKRKAKSDEVKSTKFAKKDGNGSTLSSAIKHDPDVSEQPNGTSLLCHNDSNAQLRYYYESKVKLSEYDSFIAQHYKLVCCKCQKSAETFDELHSHFQESHNKKEGYVICCFTKIHDRGCLVDHINLHLNPEYFKCEHCSEISTHRKGYSNHMKTHEIEYNCDMCDKKFMSKYLFNKHKLVHLSEDEKKFQCGKCDKSFATENCLSVHQRAVHLRIYSKLCEICGQYIPNSDTFKRHMDKHEGVVGPPLSCDICGRLMANKDSLRKHKKNIHTDGQTDYICQICLKVSPNKRALSEHIQRVHNSKYNHKCTICEKAFKRSEHLKDHMSTHTGVGTFKCPWCPRVFSANSSMHLHRKKLHPKEWQEARLKKYSGKLPPNFKAEPISDLHTYALQFGV